jgi:hypothetical protein
VRATSVDPDERFADMDALLDALALGSKSNPSRSRSRFSLLGGTAVVALVGMAGIATVSHRRGDASAPAGVASPPVYLMTDAATFDATADADVVTEATALDAGSVVDASVPDLGFAAAEAPTQPAQRTCPDLAGTYDLTTERTKGGRRSDTTYGRYRLILSVAGPGLRAQVTKTGSSDVLPVRRNLADNLERERVTRGDECAVEVVAGHGDRTYTFSLTFDGDVGHGTFVAEGDRRRGTYGGMVRIQKVLQQ